MRRNVKPQLSQTYMLLFLRGKKIGKTQKGRNSNVKITFAPTTSFGFFKRNKVAKILFLRGFYSSWYRTAMTAEKSEVTLCNKASTQVFTETS